MGLLDTIGSVFRIKESYIVGPDFQRLIESGYHSAYEDSPHEYKPYKSFVMSISNALKSSKSLPERAEVQSALVEIYQEDAANFNGIIPKKS